MIFFISWNKIIWPDVFFSSLLRSWVGIGQLHHLLETFRCSRVRPNRHRGAKFPRGYLGKRAVINHSEGQALWADSGEHPGSNTPGGDTPLSCEQIEQGCSSPSPPHSVFRHQIHVLVFTFYVSPQVFQILLQGGGLVSSLSSNLSSCRVRSVS